MSLSFQAKVQYWNLFDISVLCPFYNRTHHHHFTEDMYRCDHRRCSDCKDTRSKVYELRFPFSETTGEIGFYVDKSNGRYVAVGAQLDPHNNLLPAQDTGPGNRTPWFKRRKWEEAEEVYILDNTDEGFRLLKEILGGDEDETFECLKVEYAVGQLFGSNESWMKEYLDSSPEATLFLQGVDSTGNTALHLAATEGCPEVVSLLLRYEIDVNATNSEGRTPLMEAALWGRLDNVLLLVQSGADTEARDGRGYSAVNFATQSQKNDDERYDRFERRLCKSPSSTFSIYNIHQRQTERRQIVTFLKEREASKVEIQNSLTKNDGIEEFKFVTSLERFSISLVKEFPVSRMTKTIACLMFPSTGKNKFPPIDAMSGWGHDSEEDQVVINSRSWTSNVMKLANYLDYHLPENVKKDHGSRGQHYACHAEKQLIAYFVNNHAVLGEDKWQLRDAVPPIMIQRAYILVSREVCRDCKNFLEVVNEVLNLDIQVKEVSSSKSVT
jgi:hypothetical protein